jgi:hypothetical protein
VAGGPQPGTGESGAGDEVTRGCVGGGFGGVSGHTESGHNGCRGRTQRVGLGSSVSLLGAWPGDGPDPWPVDDTDTSLVDDSVRSLTSPSSA